MSGAVIGGSIAQGVHGSHLPPVETMAVAAAFWLFVYVVAWVARKLGAK